MATATGERAWRREILAVTMRVSEDERTVVQPAVGLVLDESPEDETAPAMAAYAARLGAAVALRAAMDTGDLPAGTEFGPVRELVRRVRLDYLEIVETNYDETHEDHWGRREALRIIVGCESLLARLGID